MKPKMILFDYGQTLVVEPQFDARRGYGAVYDRTDGGKVSRARFADFADAMFLSLAVKAHAAYHEIDDVRFLRSVCAYCDMQSRISFEDADLLYWDTATDGSHASPHAAEMLAALDARGIRTGIVSNLCFAKTNLESGLRATYRNTDLNWLPPVRNCSSASPSRSSSTTRCTARG